MSDWAKISLRISHAELSQDELKASIPFEFKTGWNRGDVFGKNADSESDSISRDSTYCSFTVPCRGAAWVAEDLAAMMDRLRQSGGTGICSKVVGTGGRIEVWVFYSADRSAGTTYPASLMCDLGGCGINLSIEFWGSPMVASGKPS